LQRLPTVFPSSPSTSRFRGHGRESGDTAFDSLSPRVTQAAYSGLHATPVPFGLGQCPPVASAPAPGSHTNQPFRIAPGPLWRRSGRRFEPPEGTLLDGRSQPHGCRAPVWASLNASPTASDSNDLSSESHVGTRLREFSFATCSGLQATPEPVVAQYPWAASSAPGLRFSASEDYSPALLGPRVGAGFCED
jgi:hypothetical protein